MLLVTCENLSDIHECDDSQESPVWQSYDALIWKMLLLLDWFCITVPEIKQRACMNVSFYYVFSDRQMPNQSSPLSAEPSVIPQIQSRITSEKIKIIQLIQKSGLEQYGVDEPFSNKKSFTAIDGNKSTEPNCEWSLQKQAEKKKAKLSVLMLKKGPQKLAFKNWKYNNKIPSSSATSVKAPP